MSASFVTKRLGRVAARHTVWAFIILSSLILQIVKCSTDAAFDPNEFAEFDEFDDDEFENIPPAKTGKDKVVDGTTSGPGPPPTTTTNQKQHEPVISKSDQLDHDEYDEDAYVEDDTATNNENDLPDNNNNNVNYEDEEDDDSFDGVVQDDDLSHFNDDEEFINFDASQQGPLGGGGSGGRSDSPTGNAKGSAEPVLKFADVPAHLRNNWLNYRMELIMLFGIAVYLTNYLYGKTKNQSLASSWLEQNIEVLEKNFSLVGDDGVSKDVTNGTFVKESDNCYSLWCTGRTGCNGMLIQLKLLKRQDLVNCMSRLLKPLNDQLVFKVTLGEDDIDNFVLAVGRKKTLTRYAADMNDLYQYTAEKKGFAEKLGLTDAFSVYTELGEPIQGLFDQKVMTALCRNENLLDYLHFSDQYCGAKPQEGETFTRLPDVQKVLIFTFNIEGKNLASERHLDELKPLLLLVFHMIDKVKRFRLSREAKQKADRNRARVEAEFLKNTHAQRQEMAQVRKEEKIRERKEKMLNEDDPDKQRRLEQMELKREAKRKQPKVKQLKIKAM